MRSGNGAHAVDRRLIVEENAAAAIDLQIDEARGQEGAGRQARLRPIGRNLAPRRKTSDAAVPNQHRGFGCQRWPSKIRSARTACPSED